MAPHADPPVLQSARFVASIAEDRFVVHPFTPPPLLVVTVMAIVMGGATWLLVQGTIDGGFFAFALVVTIGVLAGFQWYIQHERRLGPFVVFDRHSQLLQLPRAGVGCHASEITAWTLQKPEFGMIEIRVAFSNVDGSSTTHVVFTDSDSPRSRRLAAMLAEMTGRPLQET